MKLELAAAVGILMGLSVANAQVPAHAPAPMAKLASAKTTPAPTAQAIARPVVKVNASILTDRDLLRAMYTVFPYARQHNGFPQALEPEIRKAGLEIIIFEELVYQEAKRRGLTVSPSRLRNAEAEFRKQFPSQEVYEEFLKLEANGSRQAMREKIRRSLLIESVLTSDVERKSVVSVAEARAYYSKNPKQYEHGETFNIQTISIIPPANTSPQVQNEARKKAQEALRQAKATKSYREFGLLAEKTSDDDWRVNMGDRKQVERDMLPPPLVEAALKMKPGEVSDLLQFGSNYTLFRLNGYTPAGKAEFAAVQAQIQSDLQKARFNQLRGELHQRLRKTATVNGL